MIIQYLFTASDSCGYETELYNIGGFGGGIIQITSEDTLIVNGFINVTGGIGTGFYSGSGAGGSIYIYSNIIKGNYILY